MQPVKDTVRELLDQLPNDCTLEDVLAHLDVIKTPPPKTDQKLLSKIRSLPPERVAEVEDFVDFLRAREDHRLTQAALRMSEEAFARVWDNPEDADYDRL